MIKNHSTFHRKWLLWMLAISWPVLAQPQPLQLAMGDMDALKSDLVVSSDDQRQPTWFELSNEQKTILAALGAEWDRLRPWQREKMLDIASAYPKLDSQQQLRVQRQLLKWSRMTPYERENARKRYQQFQSLSEAQKQSLREKWKAHRKNNTQDASDADFDLAIP